MGREEDATGMTGDGLGGTIVRVPLTLEDYKTSYVIKESSAYLHTDFGLENGRIWITAMCQEGCFHTTIGADNLPSASNNDETKEWTRVLRDYFTAREELATQLDLTARYETLEAYYDDDKELREDGEFPVISESLWLQLKTREALARTRAKFELKMVDSVGNDMLRREQNLFNWIGTVLLDNLDLRQQLSASRDKAKVFSEISNRQQEELERAHQEHRQLVEDIQAKFYAVLNAKKARIWQLEGDHPAKLEHLNEIFEAKRARDLNNRSIDLANIPSTLDSIYVTKKKRPRSGGKGAERVKKEPELETAEKTQQGTDEETDAEMAGLKQEEPSSTDLSDEEVQTRKSKRLQRKPASSNPDEELKEAGLETEESGAGSTDYGSE